MNKLPIGETIRFAYAFTFGEIGTVIGLIWIPAVINSVAGFAAFKAFVPVFEALAANPAAGVPASFAYFPLYLAVVMAVAAMIAVAVTQQAVGLRQGPALAHVAFGAAEGRALIGLAALLSLFLMVTLALSTVVAGIAAMPAGPAAAGVIDLAGLGVIFYVLVRLSFLFVPSLVVEGGFGLLRSWQLTQGNFWRIVAVGLATVAPVALLLSIVQIAILGPDYVASQDAMARDPGHELKYMAEQFRIFDAKLPVLLGLGFVFAPILYGLVFAPAAHAYRVLSGRELRSPS